MPRLSDEPYLSRGEPSSPMPISYQSNLMQMSSNQYYLVVQINVDDKANGKHIYENCPC